MQSQSKRHCVSEVYKADVMGKVYVIDAMDSLHEVDISGNSVKEGPLDNLSTFNQAISLSTPDTPIEPSPHKYLPHKSLNTPTEPLPHKFLSAHTELIPNKLSNKNEQSSP